MHHHCVAPLAANSLHSSISRASSIASSKVRLCRDRSFFRVAIQERVRSPNWPSPITLGNSSQNFLMSADTSILTRWPNSMSLLLCMIIIRGGCSVRCRTFQLETWWYQCISRILLRHHWSSASTYLVSAFDRAQHSDPYSIIGKMQTLYSFSLVLRESRDFQMQFGFLHRTVRRSMNNFNFCYYFPVFFLL